MKIIISLLKKRVDKKLFLINISQGNDRTFFYESTNQEKIIKSVQLLENMIEVKLKNVGDKVQIKTLEDNSTKDIINSMDIFEEMLKLGIIKPISSGDFTYSGIYLKVFKYFCKKVEDSIDKLFPNLEKQEFEVPIYPFLRDSHINQNEPKCFLVSGKCFQYKRTF